MSHDLAIRGRTIVTARATYRPDLETMLPMLRSKRVPTGKRTPNRFVEPVSTSVAKLFGTYPKKSSTPPPQAGQRPLPPEP